MQIIYGFAEKHGNTTQYEMFSSTFEWQFIDLIQYSTWNFVVKL